MRVCPITAVIFLAGLALSCSSPTPDLPPVMGGASPGMTEAPVEIIVPTPDDRIGAIFRELDVVQRGKDAGALQQVSKSSDLFEGDVLRILEGGEGLLDFGSGLRLRMFNNSQIGVIAASAPGAPLDVRLFLEDGGFTGQVTEPGGQVMINTPNNAQIFIYGTTFLVAYNPQTEVTTAANFEGRVEVASMAGQIDLPAATFTLVHPDLDRPPDPPLPFSMELDEYNQAARRLQSPLDALHEMGLVERSLRLEVEIKQDWVDPITEFCRGPTSATEIWILVEEPRGAEQVLVEGFWRQNDQQGLIPLSPPVDGLYLGGWVEGSALDQPAQSSGMLFVYISAQNELGHRVELDPIQVEVGFCDR
jgi:hypothetical protein